MKSIMNLFQRIKAAIAQYFARKKYKDANTLGAATAIATAVATSDVAPFQGPVTEHPLHQQRLAVYQKFLNQYVKSADNCSAPITIGFGDSILDFSRGDLKSVPDNFNFAIAGSVSNNMSQMATDLAPLLQQCNVKHILIGCLLGNHLLAHFDVQFAIGEAVKALNVVRQLFPNAHIMVYMLPPTYNAWANTNRLVCEGSLIQWTVTDIDAVAIAFEKMGGFLGIFPRILYSADSVHFSADGKYEFDQLIDRAKHAKRATIVS